MRGGLFVQLDLFAYLSSENGNLKKSHIVAHRLGMVDSYMWRLGQDGCPLPTCYALGEFSSPPKLQNIVH